MGNNKEEIKPSVLGEFARAKSASARHMTGTEDLLSAMSAKSNQDATPETRKPRKVRWQWILVTCCCILAIAAAVNGFLYLDTKISAAVKELSALEAQLATTDAKGQLAAVTAEMKELKATNAQLRAEVGQIREAFEALKAKKNNVVPPQPKRR
jgi:FtsZ-binding cell division protein ZapB